MSINISDPLSHASYLGTKLRKALRLQDVPAASTDVMALVGLLADNSLRQMLIDKDPQLADDSDMKVATQKAIKAYVDAAAERQDLMAAKGTIDCSANPNYPAANRGWIYRVTVAGRIGGATGAQVEVDDFITCWVDGSVAGDQPTVGGNWTITQGNLVGALTAANVGSTVQAYHAYLAVISGLDPTDGKFMAFDAGGPNLRDIVGIVSMLTGAPTGALSEKGGTNGKGYVRFANGLQICWLRDTTGLAAAAAAGTLFTGAADVVANWAAAFVDNNVFVAGSSNVTTRWLVSAGAASQVTYNNLAYSSSGTARQIFIIGIGAWV